MFIGDIVEYYFVCYCGDGYFVDWFEMFVNIVVFELQVIVLGCGDVLVGLDMVVVVLVSIVDFVESIYRFVVCIVVCGGILKEVWDVVCVECDFKFVDYVIYEYCLLFNVVCVFDEVWGIDMLWVWIVEWD